MITFVIIVITFKYITFYYLYHCSPASEAIAPHFCSQVWLPSPALWKHLIKVMMIMRIMMTIVMMISWQQLSSCWQKYGQDFGNPISIVFGYNQDHDHHDHLISMISKIVINPNYKPHLISKALPRCLPESWEAESGRRFQVITWRGVWRLIVMISWLSPCWSFSSKSS